jgi:hypothetical protein
MSQRRPRVIRAPVTRPGKRPAAKERPSKLDCGATGAAGHEEVCEADAGFVADGVGSEDVGEEDGEDVSLKHMPLLQVYPRGQHLSPHVGRATPSVLARCIWFSGWRVALSWFTSQVMVWMMAQSEFAGQQMTDWVIALLRGIHAVSFGQQKSDGKPAPHCWRLDFPPHVGACRRKMWDACVVVASIDARKKHADILERRGRLDRGAMMVV